MTPQLEENLLLAFPTVFRRKSRAEGGSWPFELYGIECGDGWYHLIYAIATEIAAASPGVYAVQVKEKFGGLRFYVEGEPGNEVTREAIAAMRNAISDAEQLSFRTCEDCGEPGKPRSGGRSGGWIRTLCDAHGAKWGDPT